MIDISYIFVINIISIMKRISTLLLACGIAANSFAQSTPTIVNGDFEGNFRTVTVNNPMASITTTIPDGWYCADSLAAGLAPILALGGLTNLGIEQQSFRDTLHVHAGTAALGLKTVNLNDTLQLPGMLSNAKMTIDVGTLMSSPNLQDALSYTGGTPMYKNKLDTVKAWAFLDTSNVSAAIALVDAWGTDPTDNVYKVIGAGVAAIVPSPVYQEINIAVAYADDAFTKVDTMVLTFISSLPDSVLDTLKPLNYLVVDDVTMSYSAGTTPPTSIKTLTTAESNVTIAPNPVSSSLNVQIANFDKSKQQTLVITDVLGRTVVTMPVLVDQLTIDMSSYNSGLYQYQLYNHSSNTMEAGKFIKH